MWCLRNIDIESFHGLGRADFGDGVEAVLKRNTLGTGLRAADGHGVET